MRACKAASLVPILTAAAAAAAAAPNLTTHHLPSAPHIHLRALCLHPHCRHYHASLTPEEREAVQAEWTNGDVPIIVATIAFGMGGWVDGWVVSGSGEWLLCGD